MNTLVATVERSTDKNKQWGHVTDVDCSFNTRSSLSDSRGSCDMLTGPGRADPGQFTHSRSWRLHIHAIICRGGVAGGLYSHEQLNIMFTVNKVKLLGGIWPDGATQTSLNKQRHLDWCYYCNYISRVPGTKKNNTRHISNWWQQQGGRETETDRGYSRAAHRVSSLDRVVLWTKRRDRHLDRMHLDWKNV